MTTSRQYYGSAHMAHVQTRESVMEVFESLLNDLETKGADEILWNTLEIGSESVYVDDMTLENSGAIQGYVVWRATAIGLKFGPEAGDGGNEPIEIKEETDEGS